MFSSFVNIAELTEIANKDNVAGRILSMNIGKNNITGVIAIEEKFAFVYCDLEIYNTMQFHRGDIIYFVPSIVTFGLKNLINIQNIIKMVVCKGVLPNGQLNSRNQDESIIKAMFDPETFKVLQLQAQAITVLRKTLYDANYLEISTPILYQYPSLNPAPAFTVSTVNNKKLYLRTIQENMLKPYLMIGFKRIFELGKVFRNIQYDANFDCEFQNLDIFSTEITMQELVELCISLVTKSAKVFGQTNISVIKKPHREICSVSDNNEFKRVIRQEYSDCLLIITEYPRKDKRVLPTENNEDYGQEFHSFLYGRSFAHGYLLSSPQSTNFSGQDNSDFMGKYNEYGMYNFGGLGIGVEKLLQSFCKEDDFKKIQFYRRKY
ncbi:MAG: hypothetical protein LBS55_07395 [Prevotellaceae bacterium]|jgi:lysyl-tRNA synthetase class II|nr:hypothetical protein [Prevotellaceae bacterium]